ncbi:MAG TPA: AI-2E family transporter [Thermodesulfovibrionales bacterium]|nr:AI-2E family transporter [Thermodesulfovibrionales bacterium]
MNTDRFHLAMPLAILAVLGYLSYQVFQPFLTAIAWAIVFCVVFYPLYAFTLSYIKLKAVASLVTLFVIVVVVVGPFSYISFALISEAGSFVGKSGGGGAEAARSLVFDRRVVEFIEKIQPYTGLEGKPEEIIMDNVTKLAKVAVDQLSSGFTNMLSVTANFVFMLFAAFFFLKDGGDFMEKIKDYLPFSLKQKDRLAGQIKDMIVSTIYGGVIVAIVQGTLGGLAFAILGIHSPVLWGSVMGISSFIPMLGTAIVWVPASLFLFFEGAYIKGIAMILIGVFVIGMVDNILKPLIIGGRTKMPTVLIFFTVLGGIKLFGLLGLVMGPLVFALFLSVFEIFRTVEERTEK